MLLFWQAIAAAMQPALCSARPTPLTPLLLLLRPIERRRTRFATAASTWWWPRPAASRTC